jgi:DNA primase
VLLVEGYFDCVRLHSVGAESTIAPLGTALTEAQAELIRKYTGTAFLLYDSDRAGLKATFRAGDVLLRQGVKVLVVTLPERDDPDSFVRKHGGAALEPQLAQAIDLFERKIQILERGGWFSDLRRKRVALDRLLPTIRAAVDPITRGLYLARAAAAVGVREEVLERELRQPKTRPAASPGPTSERGSGPPVRRADRRRSFASAGMSAERELVRLLLHRRQFVESVAERVGSASFRDPRLARIFERLVGAGEAVDVVAHDLDEASIAILNELSELQGGLDVPARIIDDCVSALQQRSLGEELDLIDRELPLAADADKNQLVRRKQQLTAEITALGGRRWKSFGPARSQSAEDSL